MTVTGARVNKARRIRFWGAWPPKADEGRRNLMLTSYAYDPHDLHEPHFNPRARGYPEFIADFDALLLLICHAAMRDGYTLRIDLPRECADSADQRSVSTRDAAEADRLVARLRACITGKLRGVGYSVAIWLIRDRKGAELVDLFKKLPFDATILAELFANGVVRLSLDYARCDIMSGYDTAPRVLAWLAQACEQYGAENIAWAVGAIEYL